MLRLQKASVGLCKHQQDHKQGEDWGSLIFCYFMLPGLTLMPKLFSTFFQLVVKLIEF